MHWFLLHSRTWNRNKQPVYKWQAEAADGIKIWEWGHYYITLGRQINESTWLAFSNLFHPNRLANFPSYSFIRHYFLDFQLFPPPYSIIRAYLIKKFTEYNHPTCLFGPTRLIGTWEYCGGHSLTLVYFEWQGKFIKSSITRIIIL